MSEASGTSASGSRWDFSLSAAPLSFLTSCLNSSLVHDQLALTVGVVLDLCAACSFSSSAGGGSIALDNTDTRALDSIQEGYVGAKAFVTARVTSGSDRSFSCRPEGEAGADDLGSNNKSFQEGLFATVYTLTKNKTMDTSLRVAGLRILLEFLQVG